MACSILPEWGKTDPYAMGTGTVDECVRQLILVGSNPNRIALLDNFCMGNPHNPVELGRIVECVKAISQAAIDFQTPFISGKDSFYNYFEINGQEINIPVSFLCSGFGIVESPNHVIGSSLRRVGSKLYLIGNTEEEMGASVFARLYAIGQGRVPQTDCSANFKLYKAYYRALCDGLVLSAHDLSEGGLAVAAAEMAFSGKAGISINLGAIPTRRGWSSDLVHLFSESTGRHHVEITPEAAPAWEAHMAEFPCACIGETIANNRFVAIGQNGVELLNSSVSKLESIWRRGLTPYY